MSKRSMPRGIEASPESSDTPSAPRVPVRLDSVTATEKQYVRRFHVRGDVAAAVRGNSEAVLEPLIEGAGANRRKSSRRFDKLPLRVGTAQQIEFCGWALGSKS
jgi:hypothetical protein